ncbi:hypothetical protein [Acinetobacter junii]|uniref:hypothetical protein n=1 Tax=Acinetobacter junii TaxID=40215 RepID=UPI00321586EE
MKNKIREQSKDIENFLLNISIYISRIKFLPRERNEGEPFRLILIHLEREKEYFDDFAHKIRILIRDNPKYIEWNNRGITLYDVLSQINTFIVDKSTDIYEEDFTNLRSKIDKVRDHYERIELDIDKTKIDEELHAKLEELDEIVKNVQSAKLALEANGTDEIYKSLSDKYQNEYELNNEYFRNSLILTGCCTFFSILYTLNTPVEKINWLVFVSIKVLIVAVGVTLCTLFLRRSAHAKKLHEKAYQTHVEINAYPIFIKSLNEDDQREITKELALRYFGNDIDQTQNDKIGDLMQDQLVAGTELIKASAEMLKAKQVNGEQG